MRSAAVFLTAVGVLTAACVLTGCLSTPAKKAGDDGSDVTGSTDVGTGGQDVKEQARTCKEAVRCVSEKGCYSWTCAGDCASGVESATLGQLQNLMDCAIEYCNKFTGFQASQMARCVYESCRPEIEPCTNTGTENCAQTLICSQSCLLGNSCYMDCLDAATFDGRLGALIVSACMEAECPEAIIDIAKTMQCLTSGPCSTEYDDCLDSPDR